MSLPFAAYTDPAILAAETETVFSKEWVFICMSGELKEVGDYYATSLAKEPIIVLRDDSGELRALSNICRHRGTTILDNGFGKIDKYITCPYHAWAYSKAGALRAIPYNKVIAVDRTEHQLPSFSVATWNGLVFVNLDAVTLSYGKATGSSPWRTRWKAATSSRIMRPPWKHSRRRVMRTTLPGHQSGHLPAVRQNGRRVWSRKFSVDHTTIRYVWLAVSTSCRREDNSDPLRRNLHRQQHEEQRGNR